MAVSRADKQNELDALEAAFKDAETAILVDYRGITVPQVTELRRQIRAVGGNYRVVKNTLAKRAVAGTPFEAFTATFVGPTAVVYSGPDPVAMAKALTVFAKTTPTISIKAAVVQGRAVQAGRSTNWRTCRPGRSCTPSCCTCSRRRCSRSSPCCRRRRAG